MWLRGRWVKGSHTFLSLQGSSPVRLVECVSLLQRLCRRLSEQLVWHQCCVWAWWSVGLLAMDGSVARSEVRLRLCKLCHRSKRHLVNVRFACYELIFFHWYGPQSRLNCDDIRTSGIFEYNFGLESNNPIVFCISLRFYLRCMTSP